MAANTEVSVTLTIPFHDVDATGAVWHGHYAKYFEVARCRLLDEIGYGYDRMQHSDYRWPVTHLDTKFIKPLRFGQQVTVTARLMEYQFRLRVDYVIRDALSAERTTRGRSIQVAVTKSTGELCIGLPNEFRACLG